MNDFSEHPKNLTNKLKGLFDLCHKIKKMKILKIEENKEDKITRDMISKFGESIYHSSDVRSIFVRVNFKDGSILGFRRDEEDDELQRIFCNSENPEDLGDDLEKDNKGEI